MHFRHNTIIQVKENIKEVVQVKRMNSTVEALSSAWFRCLVMFVTIINDIGLVLA